MGRFGIYGRSSFQGDRLQAGYCGERFCVGETTANGFIRNIRPTLTRVNIVGPRALSSEIVERPPHSDGLSRMDSMELAAVGLEKQGLPGVRSDLKVPVSKLGRA